MTHGSIMDMADGTTHGITDIHITADGTEDGILTGDITTTIITYIRVLLQTTGMGQEHTQAPTRSSQAGYLHEEASVLLQE